MGRLALVQSTARSARPLQALMETQEKGRGTLATWPGLASSHTAAS